jgi:hypothetical protein
MVDSTHLRRPAITLGALCLIALATVSLRAESWEQKDWTQWTSQDCYHILWTSPWAIQGPDVTDYISKTPGHSEQMTYPMLTEMVSALVVRQALVRQAQFDQHYDKMDADQKQQFDQMAKTCLGMNFVNRFVVRFGPNTHVSEHPYVLIGGKQISALAPAQTNAISPCPTPTGYYMYKTTVDFAFPRVIGGNAVIQPGDKEIDFGEAKFDLEKMTYKGKPDY